MNSPAPDPVTTVTQLGQVWLPNALAARQFTMPSRTASPSAFGDALLEARARLDQLEELLGSAVALSGEYRRKASEFEEAAQTAWDEAISNLPPGHRLKADYVPAKELAAHCNLATLQQRRTANQWRRAADLASDLEERIRLAYRGLDGTRLDIHKRLGYFTLESNLDR